MIPVAGSDTALISVPSGSGFLLIFDIFGRPPVLVVWGLHALMHIWLLHPLRARVLDQIRSGRLDDELVKRLSAWQVAVRQKVGSVQFDGVE